MLWRIGWRRALVVLRPRRALRRVLRRIGGADSWRDWIRKGATTSRRWRASTRTSARPRVDALSLRAGNGCEYRTGGKNKRQFCFCAHLHDYHAAEISFFLFFVGAFSDTRFEEIALRLRYALGFGSGYWSRISFNGLFSTIFCKILGNRLRIGRIGQDDEKHDYTQARREFRHAVLLEQGQSSRRTRRLKSM